MAIVLPPNPPRAEPFTAVEFDVLDDQGNPVTLLICNGGMATVVRRGLPYYPRLTNLPILLGSTITVTQYGSPVRAQPNGGVIQFHFDEGIWIWTSYHWIGRPFRVYEGSRSSPFAAVVDVDADMVLVYSGRVAGFSHDCFTATVKTTDAGLDLDNPLVTNFYDVTFPTAIQGKPRPTARGKFFSAEPVIVDETAQIYELQSLPQGLWSIEEVRVGGVPWDPSPFPPIPGTWAPLNAVGPFQRFQLGSPPEGQDVRVDGTAGRYTVGQLIAAVVTDAGGKVDAAAMTALDTSTSLQEASLVTDTTPVNRLSAIDDFVTAGGCWWGINPIEQATGAAISIPDPVGKYKLTEVEINTIALNTEQPLAWRIRVGSQRNWKPESSFDEAVLQTEMYKWSSAALVYEPHYENGFAIQVEPRAVDVPLLTGTSPNPTDAANEQGRLISAWGSNRTMFDATVWMRPEDINLYDTVEVDYMMVRGQFRIVSAIRAIGGNGPSTLQLWGVLGTVPTQAAPLPPTGTTSPLPPGSGPPTFNPGLLALPLRVTINPPMISIGITSGSHAGDVLASISTTTTTGAGFSGSYTLSSGSGLFAVSGSNIVLARDLQAGDEGNTFSAQVLATENGGQATGDFVMDVVPGSQGFSGGGGGSPFSPPPPPPTTPPPPAPTPPPAPAQQGWRIDFTVSQQFNSSTPWQILFTDPILGNFTISAAEAFGGGMFPWNYFSPVAMASNFASSANGPNNLGLAVVSYNGDASAPGSAYIIIQQSPFTGNTTVSGIPGTPGTITVTAAGPGTGIG
jgi:hypothetical protein